MASWNYDVCDPLSIHVYLLLSCVKTGPGKPFISSFPIEFTLLKQEDYGFCPLGCAIAWLSKFSVHENTGAEKYYHHLYNILSTSENLVDISYITEGHQRHEEPKKQQSVTCIGRWTNNWRVWKINQIM
jgi:hypothetical protein